MSKSLHQFIYNLVDTFEEEDANMTTLSTRKAKRGKTSLGKPTILIGKKGSTDLIMKEISKYLDARKSVKVKILKSALLSEKAEEIAQKAAKATGSMIVQVRGHTFTLYKPKKLNPKTKNPKKLAVNF